MLIGVKGRRCKPLVRLGSCKPTTFRWWVVDLPKRKQYVRIRREKEEENMILKKAATKVKELVGKLLEKDSNLTWKEIIAR